MTQRTYGLVPRFRPDPGYLIACANLAYMNGYIEDVEDNKARLTDAGVRRLNEIEEAAGEDVTEYEELWENAEGYGIGAACMSVVAYGFLWVPGLAERTTWPGDDDYPIVPEP